MNILNYLSSIFFHEKPKSPMKMVRKSVSTKEAADQALKVIFSNNRPRSGR